MKTIYLRTLLFVVSLCLSAAAFAQNTTASVKTRDMMGGVYYAYHAPEALYKYTAPPAGYTPFYISHYGRHGSRWMPKDERYQWINSHFDDTDNLTKLGKDVRKRLKKIWKDAQGNGGQLTRLGAQQHKEIAERMFRNFPDVMGGSIDIEARSSTVERCQKSMASFVDRLRQLNPSLRITTDSDPRHMAYLVYNSLEMKALEYVTREPIYASPERFISALFVHPDRVPDHMRLMSEMHAVASDMQDVQIGVSLYDIFTDEEYAAVYDSNNRRMMTNNADVAKNGGIAARCGIPLWQNIVHSADSAIALSAPSATLRFGHDTNLFRLLSLLQLRLGEGMDAIVPMAANLQMVFYRNIAHGDVIVKFLHNEREATIPVPTDMWPYYRWTDVKSYYDRRIERLEHVKQLYSVNTMVGTASANTRSAGAFGKGSEEHGQTLPAVLAPNGQTFWTPQTQDTEQKCIAPYYYKDNLFQGIRASHWIVGGCTQDYGSFTVAAMTGQLRVQPAARATRFSHDDEVSHPHYYAVTLPDEHLRAELTGDSHTAIFRITPERDGLVHVVLNNNNGYEEGNILVDTLHHEVYGYNPVHRIYQGWGERAGISGHFLMTYQDTLVDTGVFGGYDKLPGDTLVDGKASRGIYLTFQGKAGKPIILRAATSFTSQRGLHLNYDREIAGKSFDEVASHLADLWAERFHTIDVSSADTAAVNQFYGAMYRTSFLPREISDVDGAYPMFASADSIMTISPHDNVDLIMPLHDDSPAMSNTARSQYAKHYMDFSMWDTYRAVHPLYNIITPTMSGDMMTSLTDMYAHCGWLPIFPCWNSYTSAMIGDHCAATLADAYVKGVRNFDIAKAYEGMRKNAFESPSTMTAYSNGMGRRALKSYLKYGYIPLEDSVKEAFHTDEQVSRTLEYAFDDFAVAQVAKALGHTADYAALMKRAANYRNVINPKTGYAQGRHANGKFDNTRDFFVRQSYITEGAPCHYTWYVPQDVPGLIQTLGGRETFVSRLDSLFECGRYWHGNEPCHQVAYLYDYANAPRKTQRWVRHILDTEYNDTPGGLSGNDDAGQMSAWYMFSSIGFYPVCPATPYYMLASPTFTSVKFNLENGRTFTIEAEGAGRDNVYVKSMTMDGQPYDKTFITHDDIMRGGTLRCVMTR